MVASEQQDRKLRGELATALATFWARGGGPSHKALNSVFSYIGYVERGSGLRKEERVRQALQSIDVALLRQLVAALLDLLRADGAFNGKADPRVAHLRDAAEKLDPPLVFEQYLTMPVPTAEPRAPHRPSGAPRLAALAVAGGLVVLIGGLAGLDYFAAWARIGLVTLATIAAVLAIVVEFRNISRRRAAIMLSAVLLTLAALVGGGLATRDRPSPDEPATELIEIRTFGEDGQLLPGYDEVGRTTTTEAGCRRSIGSGAVDALRCFGADDVIYDPCWANAEQVAACLIEPWSTDVVLVENAVSTDFVLGAVDPNTFWGLELSNGERCTFATGTAAIAAAERVNYTCEAGFVVGDPDRSTPTWSARYNREGSNEIVAVSVLRAWR